jgi:uncharacterized membrane protein YtjA (UPF0391 family)
VFNRTGGRFLAVPGFSPEVDRIMLRYALIFLLIALVAGALGFYGLEGLAMWFARVLFLVFLVLFIVSLVAGRRIPPAA